MAGGTHIFDMIKRLRENENLRKKGYFKKNERSSTQGQHREPLLDKTATQEERERIRNQVAADQMEDRKRSLVILGVSFLATVVIILLVFRLVRF